MATYNEYFNIGGYVVDPTITPWGDKIVLNKSYNEIANTPVHKLQCNKPKIDNFTGVEIQEELEPAPMKEVSWDEAYPKTMLPVDNESDMWTTPVDTDLPVESEEQPEIVYGNTQTETPEVEETLESESVKTEEPEENEHISEELPLEELVESDESEVKEEKPVVKKKNTRRTKKNK